MTEYINKAELIKECNYIVRWEDDEETFGISEARIDLMPTIKIVRCKDCKYCKIEDWDGDNYRVCTRDQHIRSGSWFCADGERRTDD